MSISSRSSPQMSVPRKSLTDFFSRALSSFHGSGSKFQVICTAAARPMRHNHDGLPNPTAPNTRPTTLIVLDSSFNPPTIAHLQMATSAFQAVAKSKEGENRLGNVRLLLLLAVNNADKAPKPAPFDQRLALMWAFARDIQESLSEHRVGQVKEPAGNQDERGLNIDVALSTQPYFHEKTAAIAQSDFYSAPQSGTGETMEQVILAGYDTLVRILDPKYYSAPTSAAQAVTSGNTTPMRKALSPFFSRARLRVTLRTDDEWGGKEDQLAYLHSIATGEGLSKIGGSQSWSERIEMVEGRKVGEEIVSSTYARAAAKCHNWERLGSMVSPRVRAWIEGEGLYAES
ncbi:hypothetical protein V8F20_005587 [Naviculisporaceae sp. PSN 640]